jgi:hypothetical protein
LSWIFLLAMLLRRRERMNRNKKKKRKNKNQIYSLKLKSITTEMKRSLEVFMSTCELEKNQ